MKNFKSCFGLGFLLIVCTLTSLLCGCGALNYPEADNNNDRIKILCAGFSQYDWVSNIVKGSDKTEASALYKSGVDIHSFQASAADIIKIADCDMFVFGGGESDSALLDISQNSSNKTQVIFDCMERLGSSVLNEDKSVAPESGHHEAEEEADEHIWLSLKNAASLCQTITEEIIRLDPNNAELYKTNADNYISKLNELDLKYANMIKNAKHKQLVFADRFPFRYLAADYGLECYAAFQGCSTETESSFDTILYLADTIDKFDLSYVLTIDDSQNNVVKAVTDTAEKRDLGVLSLNSLQTVTDERINSGMTYISAMEDNYEVLKKALDSEE